MSPLVNDVLTPAEVERDYKIKQGTQKSLRFRKQIPYVQLGGRIIRYRRSEIEAWLSARSVPVGAR